MSCMTHIASYKFRTQSLNFYRIVHVSILFVSVFLSGASSALIPLVFELVTSVFNRNVPSEINFTQHSTVHDDASRKQ